MELYQPTELTCFNSQMYSKDLPLRGNQIIIPEYFTKIYSLDDCIWSDGIFVSLGKQEESKEQDMQYAFVVEMSATKNACFISDQLQKKLSISQGDKITIQLLKNYQKAKKVDFTTRSISSLEEYIQLLPKLESMLYDEIKNYRCLQVGDKIKLHENIILEVENFEPKTNFVCLNDTDVEVKISFGEFVKEQIETNTFTDQNQFNWIQNEQKVEAVVIGTGEKVKATPIKQEKQYNPRDHKIKKFP